MLAAPSRVYSTAPLSLAHQPSAGGRAARILRLVYALGHASQGAAEHMAMASALAMRYRRSLLPEQAVGDALTATSRRSG